MQTSSENKPVRIIRLKDLARQRNQSESTIIRESKAGRFPRPIKIGLRSIGWIEAEVAAHDERAIVERDAGAKAERDATSETGGQRHGAARSQP